METHQQFTYPSSITLPAHGICYLQEIYLYKTPIWGGGPLLALAQFYSIFRYLYQNNIRTRVRSNVEMNLAQRDFAARSGLK